jgi:exosortase
MLRQNKGRTWWRAPGAGPHDGDRRRFAYYFGALCMGTAIFFLPLRELIAMSLHSELYNFIPAIFLISAYLAASERKRIFSHTRYDFCYGTCVLVFSIAAGAAGLKYGGGISSEDYLCVMSFSFWLYLVGIFIIFFGVGALAEALFPLGLLLFAVPIPSIFRDKFTVLLQTGSYLVAGRIFHALGFFPGEQGFTFTFPEISIKVARECSGIHSCVVLVILSLLAGRFLLRSKLSRIILVASAVLIATIKNGARIVALTLAAIYVDPDILSTFWHRDGGFLIFGFAFAGLMLVVLLMRKLERRKQDVGF